MPESVGLAWYSTGTVTLTQGSTAVVGVGTNWKNAGLKIGDIFTIDRVTLYMIASVNSNTSITLAQAYAGTSGNSMNYYVIRNFAATLQAELSAQVSQLVGDYESWKDGRVNEIAIPFDFSSLYKGVWATGRSYKALDIVMYNSALYVCLLAHTSASGNTPGTAGAINSWGSYAPAMPTSIDVLNYNNSGSHNSLYRGKNLGTFTEAQSAAIRAGTFMDIYIGDYWVFSNIPYTYYWPTSDTTAQAGKTYYADATGTALETQPETGADISGAGYFEKLNNTYTGTMRAADLDYYLISGNNIILYTHHVVVVPDTNMFGAPMNATNTTEGGYFGSKMRTVYLRRAEAIFKACFGENHVLKYRDILVNAVANGRSLGSVWCDNVVELMDERMVYGSLIFDSSSPDGSGGINIWQSFNRDSVSCKQLNLFRHRPDLISYRYYYWLRNVVSAACFANVSHFGHCSNVYASQSGGVRPAALIY